MTGWLAELRITFASLLFDYVTVKKRSAVKQVPSKDFPNLGLTFPFSYTYSCFV